MQKYWSVRAAADNPRVGELLLYGVISNEQFFEDDVSPRQIRNDIDALGEIDELHVFVNSPGGSVFAGHAIHAILSRVSAKTTAFVDGVAASAASVVIMGADEVVVYPQSIVMIHNPWALAIGDAAEMRQVADSLDKIRESIVAAYANKTDIDREQLTAMMDAETWMTAEEAIEKGFADRLAEDKQIAASLCGQTLSINGYDFDVSRYRNQPPLRDEQAPAASSGAEVTTTQLQHALARALGYELVDEPQPKATEDEKWRLAAQLEAVKLKEVIEDGS